MENRYQIMNDEKGFAIVDSSMDMNNDERIITVVDRESKAGVIVDELNKLNDLVNVKPLNLHKDFEEYENLLCRVDKTSRRLVEIDEIYTEEFKIILQQAIEDKVDFKMLYGGNTEKTRKQYVNEQLTDLLDEKKELKFIKDNDLRRIEFLKRLIDMKTKLIGV